MSIGHTRNRSDVETPGVIVGSAASTPAHSVATDRRASRWPLWAAASFVVLYLAAALVVPSPPSASDSGQTVVAYYRDNAAGVRLSTWLIIVSGLPYVIFVAWLRSRLTSIGRDVALLGGITLGGASVVWAWFAAGLSLAAPTVQPATARSLADVADYYGPSVTISALLLAGPVLVAARQNGGLPRWLTGLTLLFVAEQAIESFTVFPTHGFFGPGGGVNVLVGAPLFLLWVLAVAAAARHLQPAEDARY